MTPIVDTTSGKVAGSTDEQGVHAFLGVPYGDDTSGKARFLPPQVPNPWTGVRDATDFGPVAPQVAMDISLAGVQRSQNPDGTAKYRGGEDCLVLNVWTPALDSAKRPVMVWLHGGGFTFAEGTSPGGVTSGHVIARTKDVVSISLNHRLGVLGYLHLGDVLGDDYAVSGVVGQLDLVLALQWVRDNVAAFGGDPDNVTIYGESGGGAKGSTLLAMPSAKGLFGKTMIQSGAGVRMTDRDEAAEFTEQVLQALDLPRARAHELMDVPVAQLLEAADEAQRAAGPMSMFRGRMGLAPVVGNAELPEHPFDPAASPLCADIPVVIGTTMHEAAFGFPVDLELSEDDLTNRMAMLSPEHGEALTTAYREAHPTLSSKDLFILAASDRARVAAAVLAERKLAGGTAPVWSYIFAAPNQAGYSPHGMELAYHFELIGPVGMAVDDPHHREVSRVMSEAWANFARSGDPDTQDMRWPTYTLEGRETMIFDDPPSVGVDIPTKVRDAWRDAGLYH